MNTAVQPYTRYTSSALSVIAAVQDNYSYHARDFVTWCAGAGLDVTEESIGAYFKHLNQSDYAAGTVRIKRQAVIKRVRQLFRDRPIEERMKLDATLKDLNVGDTRAPKVNSTAIGRDKILSELEYSKLVEGARSERQKLFMITLWVTGMRISEALSIKHTDCEPMGDRIRVRIMGKGRKERFIYLPTVLQSAIQKTFAGSTWLFETRTGKPYSRSYVSGQIAKIGRLLLNKRISAHTFRHSFATRKIKETGKIQAVSQYLGHSSVSITLNLYCHEELSAADLASESDMIGLNVAA
jgi:integrase/recombinase XerD